MTVDMIKTMIDKIITEQELANLFVYVENVLFDIEDNEYDYEEGTDEYQNAHNETELWLKLHNQLKEKIFDILRLENVIIPEQGQISVLIPFMKRNGYKNDDGWWESIEKSKGD